MKGYADVIIDIMAPELDRTFVYRIPEALCGSVEPGCCVKIPFGRGDGLRQGYVIALKDDPGYDASRIKDIKEVVTDPSVTEGTLVALAAWMAHNYGSTMSAALRVVFPIRKRIKPRVRRYLHISGDEGLIRERLEFYDRKNQKARFRLLSQLFLDGEIPEDIAAVRLGATKSVIDALVEHGVCVRDNVRIYRGGMGDGGDGGRTYELLPEQKNAVDGVLNDYDRYGHRVSLIKGVTGSGKTEVYIEIARRIVERGKKVIVLIPEIALTYQTVMRFYRQFGDRVSSIHSRLQPGERYDQFERAARGELDVMIGPRSALFTPFSQLGAIIMDEEHEGSYKSEQTPKYHAREVAIRRASMAGACVVLGSATPSVDSYFRAVRGEFTLYELKHRATGALLPTVKVVDMRQELRKGNRSPISDELYSGIADRLSRKEQVMLFINRRGYAGFVSCRNCGYVFRCEHCDVSMTLHSGRGSGSLICHYCGSTKAFNRVCPECGSKYVGTMKAGTQAMEEELIKLFPGVRVMRMDMDTTRGKDGHEKILSGFSEGGADILVGTQMIVKGHDFANVTLVGILAADMSLFASDYRAGERTFALLTQAAGRAGRGSKKGEVVVQTYNPDDAYIRFGAAQDYGSFFEYEMRYRSLLSYPPAGNMTVVLFEGASREKVERAAEDAHRRALGAAERIGSSKEAIRTGGLQLESSKPDGLSRSKIGSSKVSVLGVAPAQIAYINDIFRYVIYLKSDDYEALVSIKDALEAVEYPGVSVQFDFNPLSGY